MQEIQYYNKKWMYDHDLQNPDMHCSWKYMPCFHVDSNYSVLGLNTHLRTKEVIVLRKKITDANKLHMNCIQGPMTLTYNSIWLLEI